ncbi:hypothetical protein DI53_0984 [Sphingobacterium deserti]|uniref:Uncharacterized protein n=1 Tax=Sphingobacterium deserti TaxID=1229276 RepID=A0A0B8T4W3_9SPHI|nr:hypothetical protein DI53_0984 [Sphingobacterium deserti]
MGDIYNFIKPFFMTSIFLALTRTNLISKDVIACCNFFSSIDYINARNFFVFLCYNDCAYPIFTADQSPL